MSIITAEKITFSYANAKKEAPVFVDQDLRIEDGEFVCLIGHSGCGKTTLLKLIAGLQLPDSGQICINGDQVLGPGPDRAMVFQNYALFPWMTARRNVMFGIKQVKPGLNKKELAGIANHYLEQVGMASSADVYPTRLSGGMQQRVAIARALAMDVDTLLLDEPFGALDTRNRTQLQDLLLRLWSIGEQRKTVVFVTHDIDEAIILADRIIFMRPGRICCELKPPFPRPRNREELVLDPAYRKMVNSLRDMFFLDEEAANE